MRAPQSQVQAQDFRSRLRHNLNVFLPKLALPLAILVGCSITAGTTYALVQRVQHLIAHAAVSSDPAKWMEEARTKAYEPCYFGCDDCSDPSSTYKACAKTATANISGVICDANLMWNWKDRYPLECLKVLGKDYQSDALQALKQRYRNQLAIVILTVLAGLVGAVVVYKSWNKIMRRRKQRAEEKKWMTKDWPKAFDAAPPERKEKDKSQSDGGVIEKDGAANTSRGRHANINVKAILASLLAFCSLGRTSAYPCAGHGPSFDQYFHNANRTLFGVVHGWLSNCYDVTSCSTRCSGGGAGSGSSCYTSCDTVTYSNVAPEKFVERVVPSVKACGFKAADAVEGDVDMRVANARIERKWWVMISVNGYNVTSTTDTDDAVLCLHDIGSA